MLFIWININQERKTLLKELLKNKLQYLWAVFFLQTNLKFLFSTKIIQTYFCMFYLCIFLLEGIKIKYLTVKLFSFMLLELKEARVILLYLYLHLQYFRSRKHLQLLWWQCNRVVKVIYRVGHHHLIACHI